MTHEHQQRLLTFQLILKIKLVFPVRSRNKTSERAMEKAHQDKKKYGCHDQWLNHSPDLPDLAPCDFFINKRSSIF